MISASENLLFRDIHASVHQGIIGGPIFGFHVNGKFHVLAGNGLIGDTFDGLTPDAGAPPQATDPSVRIYTQSSSWLSISGSSVLIPSLGDYSVRKVDSSGLVTRFAGVYGSAWPFADGSFATSSPILPVRVVVSPDGYDYTTARNDNNDGNANRVVRLRRADDTTSGNDILVPSLDGSEVYEFDATGKHLYTRAKYAGATSLTVGYTGGYVSSLSDVGGPTTISGYGTGTVTITSPTGQATKLTLTGTYLTGLDDPALHHTTFAYDPNTHLLSQMTEPVATNVHNFGYTSTGLLTSDVAPGAGAGSRLTRTDGATTVGIDFTTAESRTTTHVIDTSATVDTFSDWNLTPATFTRSEQRTQTTLAASNPTIDTWYTDSAHAHKSPDGTSTTTGYAPDPRFGMNLAYATAVTVTTPQHPDTGPKCFSGYNGMCIRTSRTASGGMGFSATSVTDERWGSFNNYGTHATSTWTSVATADCASPPCIVQTSSEQRKIVKNLDSLDRVKVITLPQNDPVAVSPININYGVNSNDLGKIVSVQQGTRTYSIHHAASGFTSSIDTPLLAPALTFDVVDDDGRVKQQTIKGGTPRVVGFDYDANGNRQLVTLPKNNAHNFSYNGLNLLGSYDPPAIGYSNTTYDYDLDGLIRTVEPPTGNVVTNTRDAAGRVSQISYAHPTSGTITVTLGYDPATGQACTSSVGGCTATNGTASSAAATVTTIDGYDGQLLVSEETKLSTPSAFDHVIHYDYDNALRLGDRYVDTAGNWTQATFQYDNDSVVSSVGLQGTTFNVYRGANGMLKCTNVGSVCEAYTYDSYGALTEQKAVAAACDASCSASGTILLDIQYTHNDPLGRVTARLDTIGTNQCSWAYTYSTQFPEWFGTASASGGTNCGPYNLTQSYDSDGNQSFNSFWSYDAQDRLGSDGYWTYAYDAQGNVTSEHDPSNNYYYYSYDPVGNLRHYAAGSTTVDYDVDYRNRRIGKIAGPALSQGYLYDGDRVIAHVTSGGAVDATYVYITKRNVPDLIAINGYTLRMLSDANGTVRRVVIASGAQAGQPVGDYDFDPYGVAIGWPNPAGSWPSAWQPFGFAGGLWDGDVGLYRFGARDYNPWKGRWWSKDPIGFAGGLNQYAYCNNDPLNCIDPSGRFSLALPLLIPELGLAGAEFGPIGLGLGVGAGVAVNVGIYLYQHPPAPNSCPVTAGDLASSPYRTPGIPAPSDPPKPKEPETPKPNPVDICYDAYTADSAECYELYGGNQTKLANCLSDATQTLSNCIDSVFAL
ncbi:RHS repeat-associated core domain-containing protein [Paraburkholderia sp.]|uniref:RHS repeat-associated core domain-containing protein n=1 Tax=Paraburkholderia sp. TaxID=1926495 RepID=UPI002F404610